MLWYLDGSTICLYHNFVFFIMISFGLSDVNENIAKVVSLNILDVDSGQIIPPAIYGVILGTNIDIDNGDGGLYAELIYNRAFQV